VVKEGAVVDIDALPLTPLQTREPSDPLPEEACYKPFVNTGQRFPMCAACVISGQ
jgi:hypothetical protein